MYFIKQHYATRHYQQQQTDLFFFLCYCDDVNCDKADDHSKSKNIQTKLRRWEKYSHTNLKFPTHILMRRLQSENIHIINLIQSLNNWRPHQRPSTLN